MSKIAREITKKVSIVALATSFALQALPVSAVETATVSEDSTVVVEESVKEVLTESLVEESKTVEVNEVAEESNVIEVAAVEAVNEEVVNFPDKNLEAKLREKLGLSETEPITKNALSKLKKISIKIEDDIVNLEGLQYGNLLELEIDDVTGMNLSPISQMKDLKEMVSYKGAFDLNLISNNTNLESIMIKDVINDSLDPIKNCTKLLGLSLNAAVNMKDINSVSNMKDLEILMITGDVENLIKSKLEDISPVVGLNKLMALEVSYTNVSNINILKDMPSLLGIFAGYCNIEDISQLLLKEGQKLYVNGNKIANVTLPLSSEYSELIAANQNVILKEIVTDKGDVVYKVPYNKELITSVEIDEKDGKYNPETNEITFFNVTENKDVTYKIRLRDNIDTGSADSIILEEDYYQKEDFDRGGYDYSAKVTQPLRIKESENATVTTPNGVVSQGTSSQNTSAIKPTVSEGVKTGDAGVLGAMSLAAMSIAGMFKSRKRR